MATLKFTHYNASSGAVRLRLTGDTAPEGFSSDCKFWPDPEGGYRLKVSAATPRAFAKAGRVAAGLGITCFKIESELKLEPLSVYRFAQALYDGKQDYLMELPCSEEELAYLNQLTDLVLRFRSLGDLDSKHCTPKLLCQTLASLFTETVEHSGGCQRVELLTEEEKAYAQCAGIRAVSSGSGRSGCLGIFEYAQDAQALAAAPEIVLVGKGITFDSGGYDLKPPKFMDSMRTDKLGAVNLMGALCLAIAWGLKRHVKLYLCCAENLVSSSSMLPGDLIAYPNGLTVEVTNTDAEGRLVLADGLIRASLDRPQFILDAATLTGAAKNALGREMVALFTRDNRAPRRLNQCFEQSGEQIWQLPFVGEADYYLASTRASLANAATRDGPGASTAAAFLERFVETDIPWVHLDLSAAYLPKPSQILGAGPTGTAIVPLAQWLCQVDPQQEFA